MVIASRLRRIARGSWPNLRQRMIAAAGSPRRSVLLLSLDVLPHLQCAAITHVKRHIEDDQKADISNPAMLFQNARDEVGGEAHQRDRECEAEYHDHRMLARRACHGENVVERHRHVGKRDLPYRLTQRLLTRQGVDSDRPGRRKILKSCLMLLV